MIASKPFHDRAVDGVANVGQYLIDHSEDIVGNVDNIQDIAISIEIGPGAFPQIRVTYHYDDRELMLNSLGKTLG